MKRIVLLVLLLIANINANSQAVVSFDHYRNNHSLGDIICEMNKPDGFNRFFWATDRASRYAVIRYCDSIIDQSWNFMLTYHDYKVLKKQDSIKTIPKAPKQIMVQQMAVELVKDSSLQGDTIRTALKDTSAAGVLSRASHKVLGSWMILQFLDPLIYFLSLDEYNPDENEIRMNLSILQNYYTVQILSNNYEYKMRNGTLLIPDAMQMRNRKLIGERLEVVEGRCFVLYQSAGTKNRRAESADFFMDNDFFSLDGRNQDREYTGGGALTVSTDYLKFRFLKLGWLLKNSYPAQVINCTTGKYDSKRIILNKGEPLSYQSIKLGMHFYTPYIRFRNDTGLASELFGYDRPFGSFIYFERSKYRIWPKGLLRHHGQFQVGQIGSNAGRDIQGLLHRDAVTSSQKVFGWHKQVMNGGRWIAQLNHRFDVMLFSTSNKFASVFDPGNQRKAPNKKSFDYFGISVYSSSELMLGGFYSAYGTGIFISMLDFTKQSGQNLVATYTPNRDRINDFEFGINAETGFRYRRVMHNSMLQGFGYLRNGKDDEYDDEAPSVYTLADNTIAKNMFIWEVKFTLRWRKMQLYYNMCLQTKEYTLVAPDYTTFDPTDVSLEGEEKFYDNTVVPEMNDFNSWKWYGYGRVGVVWVIE